MTGLARTHGGDVAALAAASGLPEAAIVDASASINPLGPPDWLDAAFAEGRRKSGHYPDPACRSLREAAAGALHIPPECLVFGNGADDLMFALARTLASVSYWDRRDDGDRAGDSVGFGDRANDGYDGKGDNGDRAGNKPVHLVEAPSYASYRDAAEGAGCAVWSLPARMPTAFGSTEASGAETDEARYNDALTSSPPGSVLWLGAPNNPTGVMPADYPGMVVRLAMRHPNHYIVCDEAFLDFVSTTTIRSAGIAATEQQNLIVVSSMTKFWAVPGLRIGYTVCSPKLAARLRAALPSWPLNAVAEVFARMAFEDPTITLRRQMTTNFVSHEMRRVGTALTAISGIKVFSSEANYYLLHVAIPDALANSTAVLDGDSLVKALAQSGFGIRSCLDFKGLGSSYVRVALRTTAENDALIAAITNVASTFSRTTSFHPCNPIPGPRASRRAKALMIQGCSSGAGKSLITAAFCRIFRDDGLDVAPYKAQNMSLNSAVTPNGLEIGRAQAVQASACGLESDVRMNPVLLKPESDHGSQVILLGQPYARLSAADYYTNHELMRDTARTAYDSLAAEHELIVLEGAGSPAEINLKSHDFVNMGAARHAGARVVLVGDIDRGGVFASFIGHVATFAPDELAMLSGFLVNKFRGDPALLGDAYAMTRTRTGYPVLGTVPMLSDINIPDEDEPIIRAGDRPGATLRIAVPKLRRVSNFTDLDAFVADTDVAIVPVSSGQEIDNGLFDAIIIPGTKSTVADLNWLRETNIAESIAHFSSSGGTVVGICGGYQMLGRELRDPDGVESSARLTPGLGLLPIVTTFVKDKTLSRVKARWLPTGEMMEGYEIHHGVTLNDGDSGHAQPIIAADSGTVLGYGTDHTWGSYLHGVFDANDFRASFLNRLRKARGLTIMPPSSVPSLDTELSRLAEIVRRAVDLSTIRKELGV